MKKKSILMILLALALCMSLFMTACGGSKEASNQGEQQNVEEQQNIEEQQNNDVTTAPSYATLEDYLKNNSTIKETIVSSAEESGMTTAFKGNEIIYSLELSGIEGYTADTVKSEVVLAAIQDGLEAQKSVFGNSSKSMEELTGVDGIITTILYTWEGEEVLSRSFTAADAE